MTVIRPNSISGITSITAQANEINIFRSNGTIAGLNLNGINFNTTAGISTLAALKVTGNVDIAGVLTYQDVTNVDSLGIGTFRTGINVSGGQLDVGSNIKLGNAGVITATAFVGDGSGLTGAGPSLTGSTNNTIVTVTGANAIQGEANLTFDGTNLDIDSDSGHLRIGDDQDLDLYHNGSNGFLKNSTGQQLYRSGTHTFENAAGSTEYLRFHSNGNVGIGTVTNDQRFRVYSGIGDNAYKTALIDSNSTHGTRLVITNSNNTSNRGLGIMVGGQYAGTDKASFGWFNSDNTYVSHSLMTITSGGNVGINQSSPGTRLHVSQDWVSSYGSISAEGSANALVGLGLRSNGNYRGALIWRDGSSGNYLDLATFGGAYPIYLRTNGTQRLQITGSGNVEPFIDNTYNFGSLTKRWANIYTADLNLSNEGSKNDVDGTWGQYTIQEGEDNLYLINKRSGKKYKFLLQEVS